MFSKKNDEVEGQEAKKKKGEGQQSKYGTSDEMELLRMIVIENKGLFMRVVEKIRMHRTLRKDDKYFSKKKT